MAWKNKKGSVRARDIEKDPWVQIHFGYSDDEDCSLIYKTKLMLPPTSCNSYTHQEIIHTKSTNEIIPINLENTFWKLELIQLSKSSQIQIKHQGTYFGFPTLPPKEARNTHICNQFN